MTAFDFSILLSGRYHDMLLAFWLERRPSLRAFTAPLEATA